MLPTFRDVAIGVGTVMACGGNTPLLLREDCCALPVT
jgi:hypothetical protein